MTLDELLIQLQEMKKEYPQRGQWQITLSANSNTFVTNAYFAIDQTVALRTIKD